MRVQEVCFKGACEVLRMRVVFDPTVLIVKIFILYLTITNQQFIAYLLEFSENKIVFLGLLKTSSTSYSRFVDLHAHYELI
jgi:hypothetical protein